MKVLSSFCAALLFAAVLPRAVASEPSGTASPMVDPTNPSGAAPTVMQPAPEAPPLTAPAAKSDPALDLLPAMPGQLAPEPTLTPDNPTGERPKGPLPHAPAKTTRTEIAEQDLAMRIHFRQAKTRALEDPAIQAEWQKSIVAHTDLQRRESLTKYYKLYYARILKLDPSVQKMVTFEQEVSIRRLTQARIAPTEALSAEESTRRGFVAAPFTPDQF